MNITLFFISILLLPVEHILIIVSHMKEDVQRKHDKKLVIWYILTYKLLLVEENQLLGT